MFKVLRIFILLFIFTFVALWPFSQRFHRDPSGRNNRYAAARAAAQRQRVGGDCVDLKMRWWVYRSTDTVGLGPLVKMFVLYFDPAQSKRLAHSTGLQKGLIGRIDTFAARDMAKQNNVIIAHEFLHTLGATDKYDPATNQPLYPDGYANPDLKPLLPQRYAEIMAGRTPLSQAEAETPTSLDDALIGSKTALEINWL